MPRASLFPQKQDWLPRVSRETPRPPQVFQIFRTPLHVVRKARCCRVEPNRKVWISLRLESRAYPPSVSHFPAAVSREI